MDPAGRRVPSALIVGSGPAAAGVALALAADPDVEIRVVDVGHRLEARNVEARARVAGLPPDRWAVADIATLSVQPVRARVRGLPEKRAFGSDFPFRDVGQLRGLQTSGDVNPRLVSGAYGGFSNVWGAQVMPFSTSSFDDWPFPRDVLEPHYRAILDAIPFAGREDDLAATFPLYGSPVPLPPTTERTAAVLRRYDTHRDALNRLGVTVGEARLALRASPCVTCGLCMTGCPYDLIYSASHSFDALVERGRIAYRGGLLALRVAETGGAARVEARDLATGGMTTLEADRVFVAAGAVGSTRVMLNSLARFDEDVELRESAQFLLPAVSRRALVDPREERAFTLNQFNVLVATGASDRDLSQIHFYPYNSAVDAALPAVLRARLARPLTTALLRRLSVGFGYLPSWASPRLRLRATRDPDPGRLPRLSVAGERVRAARSPMFRAVARRLLRAAPYLDLWPALPATYFAGPGKSYHWGGTFPHRAEPDAERWSSDLLGRVAGWERVHVVDGAVLPSVAATTFTLTVMANAHRIATASRGLARA